MNACTLRTFFVLFFILTFLCPGNTVVAGISPDTTIKSEHFTSFTPGKRLEIKVRLRDSEGILEARCYFKTHSGEQFFYSPLIQNQAEKNNFSCTLPAFNKNTHKLNYFFLVINNRRQVIRSLPFSASAANETQVQTVPSPHDQVTVYSELPDINLKKTGLADAHLNFQFTQYNNLFGLRAGIYSNEVLPDSFKVMHGYFGGFQIDKNNNINPIMGTVPLLETKENPPEDSQGESSYRATPSTTPNIVGNDWSGYFQYGYSSNKTQLTAKITRSGTVVTITTSKTGIAHYLAGTMNSTGDMLIYDSFDGEDWTTHFGPATSTSINLYDYAWPPQPGQPEPPLNKIILSRHDPTPPSIPSGVHASDGTLSKTILVSWNNQERTKYFQIYACENSSTSTCSLKASTTLSQYSETNPGYGLIYYRIKACNDYGCSSYSKYDTGYRKNVTLPFLHLLLGS